MKDHRQPGPIHLVNGRIDYSSGNSLEYQKEEGKLSHIVTYHHEGKKLVLNDLLPDHDDYDIIAIEPVKGARKNHFQLESRSVLMDMIAMKEEAYVLAMLHEIGHAYARVMPAEHITRKDDLILFSERNAWAYALKTMRRHELLSWLPRKELRSFYYDRSLKTYQSKLVDAVVKRYAKRWKNIDDLVTQAPGVRS